MKIKYIIVLFITISTSVLFAQEKARLEITGQIIVNNPDLSDVTVFNTSSNEGTITDEKGKFSLRVALNDRVEISALQFKKFSVVVNEEILESRIMTVFLVEQVNKLPEVFILPYGLTGDLQTDVSNTNTFNPDMDALYFGMEHADEFEFSADYKTAVKNDATAMSSSRLHNGTDIVKVVGMMLKPIFNSKNKKERNTKVTEADITDKYPTEYLLERLNIPKDEIYEFIYFVEDSGMDKALLDEGKELEFLDYLIAQSKAYHKQKRD